MKLDSDAVILTGSCRPRAGRGLKHKRRHRIYYAHSLENQLKEHWQPLREHLLKVQDEAATRGAKFGVGKAAGLAGLLHDLGKYTEAFQKRLAGGSRVDHATAGAQQVCVLDAATPNDRGMAQLIAYAIAGHHAGLPDELEKEEIFIVEKDEGGASQIHGAQDVRGLRRDLRLYPKYRSGALGGIPRIG